MTYVVSVRVPQLWASSHSERHRKIAETIIEFRRQGNTYPAIAEALNRAGVRSPRGRKFYAALAWSIYNKWAKRAAAQDRLAVVRLSYLSISQSLRQGQNSLGNARRKSD